MPRWAECERATHTSHVSKIAQCKGEGWPERWTRGRFLGGTKPKARVTDTAHNVKEALQHECTGLDEKGRVSTTG